MTRPLILVDPLPRTLELICDPPTRAKLESLADLVIHETSRMPAEMVDRHLPDVSIIMGQTKLPRERLMKAKKLRAIIDVETNFTDAIDYDYCFANGIHVLTPGSAFADAVAESALGMAIDLARGITRADRDFRHGREAYGLDGNVGSFSLFGESMGLIGYGDLARSFHRLVQPFKCEISVHDPWVPDYVLADHPGIKGIEDLKANWQIFEDAQNPGKGRLYNGPPGWASEVIIGNYYKALVLADSYELFSPGSGENLKASIARAVAQKKPWVGYYWGPSDVVGKYHMVRLGMPDSDKAKFTCLTDANCTDPQVTGWAAGEVAVAVVSSLKEQAPAVAEFLGKMQVPNQEISDVLAWGDDNGATSEETAVHFLKEYPQLWTPWVPAEVAAKVKAAL